MARSYSRNDKDTVRSVEPTGCSVCSAALKMLCRRLLGVLLADKCDSWEDAQGSVRCLLLQGKEGPGCTPAQNNSLLIVEDSLNYLSPQPGTRGR